MKKSIKRRETGPSKAQWGFMAAFLLIPLVLVTCITVVPMIKAIYTSFFDYSGYGAMTFLGFANYAELFTDSKFFASIWNDIKILLMKEVIVIVLAVFFSISITRLSFGKHETKFFKFIYYIPNILSVVVTAKCWKYFFDFDLFSVVSGLKTPADGWIGAYPAEIVTFVGSWCGIGMFMIILIAAINNIPKEIYEAADIDGAGQFRQLMQLTIPAVLPQIRYMAISIVTSIVGSNMNFVKLFVGDYSQFTTMGLYQYNAAFVSYRYGYAYAASVVVMAIVFVISWLINRFVKEKGEN